MKVRLEFGATVNKKVTIVTRIKVKRPYGQARTRLVCFEGEGVTTKVGITISVSSVCVGVNAQGQVYLNNEDEKAFTQHHS